MTHRLFLAIRPPSAVRDALIDLMEGIDNARWQDDDQLHLTLRYIGEVESPQANDLAEALLSLRFEPFEVVLEGVGHFEDRGTPRALWADVAPNPALLHLQRKVERVCIRSGIEPDHRRYMPHVTLARLNRSSGPIGPFLARNGGKRLGSFGVDSYMLYESHLRPDGSVYEPVMLYRSTR